MLINIATSVILRIDKLTDLPKLRTFMEDNNLKFNKSEIARQLGIDDVDRTKVTLMLNEAVNDAENEAVNDAEKSLEGRISALIKANPKISKIKMAEKLNVSKATIERTIKASKKIKRVGPDKGGHWEIIE